MRSRSTGRHVLLGISAVVAACSPFADGGTPADTHGQDASSDGAPFRADDGGAPGEPDGDANRGKGCARFVDAGYCQDFDGPDPLNDANWTIIQRDAGEMGGIDLVGHDAVSAPNAARFALRSTPTACSSLTAARTVVGSANRARVRFAVKPSNTEIFFSMATAGASGVTYVVLLSLSGAASVQVVLQRRAGSTRSDLAKTTLQLPSVAVGVVSDVDVRADAVGHGMNVTFAGVSGTLALPEDFAAASPYLTFGPYCASTNSEVTVDDIAVWLD